MKQVEVSRIPGLVSEHYKTYCTAVGIGGHLTVPHPHAEADEVPDWPGPQAQTVFTVQTSLPPTTTFAAEGFITIMGYWSMRAPPRGEGAFMFFYPPTFSAVTHAATKGATFSAVHRDKLTSIVNL